jgi:hypothetical protein
LFFFYFFLKSCNLFDLPFTNACLFYLSKKLEYLIDFDYGNDYFDTEKENYFVEEEDLNLIEKKVEKNEEEDDDFKRDNIKKLNINIDDFFNEEEDKSIYIYDEIKEELVDENKVKIEYVKNDYFYDFDTTSKKIKFF